MLEYDWREYKMLERKKTTINDTNCTMWKIQLLALVAFQWIAITLSQALILECEADGSKKREDIHSKLHIWLRFKRFVISIQVFFFCFCFFLRNFCETFYYCYCYFMNHKLWLMLKLGTLDANIIHSLEIEIYAFDIWYLQ